MRCRLTRQRGALVLRRLSVALVDKVAITRTLLAVGGSGNGLNVRDTFSPDMLNANLISPVKVYTGFLQGSYDLQALAASVSAHVGASWCGPRT